METLLRRSFAGPVGSARQHLDAVESFARGYVQRLPARSGEGDVGGLATQLDSAEIATLGIEYLHAGERGDVDTIAIVERKAVGAALLAGRNVVQLREGALAFDLAIGLDVVGE